MAKKKSRKTSNVSAIVPVKADTFDEPVEGAGDDGGGAEEASESFGARRRRAMARVRRVQREIANSPTALRIRENFREWKSQAHHALPEWMKDNDYLHAGHRPPLPCFLTCFKTIFSLHTETINIWTHLIGSLILLVIALVYVLHDDSEKYTWQRIIVFNVFFVSAVLCMTFSWVYHTVACHSHPVCQLFSKLDYSGISILVLGSFVPWLYYGFYCDYTHMVLYISVMALLSTCCIIFSLWSRFNKPCFRAMRALVFVGLGLSGLVPFLHGLSMHGMHVIKFFNTLTVAALYILGAAIYALRVPERFLPGKLDIWGNSHQVFHVLVVMAAVLHYQGIHGMAEDRHVLGECPSPYVGPDATS